MQKIFYIMRIITFLLLFLTALTLSAQKLRSESGFTTRYYLEDKPIKTKPLALHLEKTNARSSSEFALMRKASKNSWWWLGAFVVGTIGAVASEDPAVAIGFSAPAIAGATGVLVCTINENKHRKRAIRYYNEGVKP